MSVQGSSQQNLAKSQAGPTQRAALTSTQASIATPERAAPRLQPKSRPLLSLPQAPAPQASTAAALAQWQAMTGEPTPASAGRHDPEEEARLRGDFNQAVLDGLKAEFCTLESSAAAAPGHPAGLQWESHLIETSFSSLVDCISRVASDAVATALEERRDQAIEQVFNVREEAANAAFCRIATDRARHAKNPALLKQAMEDCMFGPTWPVTTNLAMVLSALRAASLRGQPTDPGVLEHLLRQTLERVPEAQRLESLVIFRSMFGGEHTHPAAADSYARIKKRYTNLAAENKPVRLFQWSQMDWWVADIGRFAGHQQPMRLRAIEGLLAVLNPRLSTQSESCRRDCLLALLSRLLPDEGDGDQLEHWDGCVKAWSLCAAGMRPLTLALMLIDVTRPNRQHDDRLWFSQLAVLLKALSACLANIAGADQRKFLLDAMEHWFAVNVAAVIKLQARQPKAALESTLLAVPLLRQLATPFALRLELDLRHAVNPRGQHGNSTHVQATPPADPAPANN